MRKSPEGNYLALKFSKLTISACQNRTRVACINGIAGGKKILKLRNFLKVAHRNLMV